VNCECSSTFILFVPRSEHVTIGGRAFSSTAAREWNSLPTTVHCSLLSHWTFFDAAWKLNYSHVFTIDTAPVNPLYCCVTHFPFPCSFLLWPQPWSLLTIMLLRHSFLIIIIIIIIIIVKRFLWKKPTPLLCQILMVLWINKGLTLNLSFITPKRHNPAWFHVFWAIVRKTLSTGLTCRRVSEKRYRPK